MTGPKLAIGMRKNFPFRKIISREIIKLSSLTTRSRLYFEKKFDKDCSSERKATPLSGMKVIGLFVILIIGVPASVVVLICEKLKQQHRSREDMVFVQNNDLPASKFKDGSTQTSQDFPCSCSFLDQANWYKIKALFERFFQLYSLCLMQLHLVFVYTYKLTSIRSRSFDFAYRDIDFVFGFFYTFSRDVGKYWLYSWKKQTNL